MVRGQVMFQNSNSMYTDSMIYMRFPLKFRGLKKTRYGPTDGPTDGRMDGRTDRPSSIDAWMHLKMKKKDYGEIESDMVENSSSLLGLGRRKNSCKLILRDT